MARLADELGLPELQYIPGRGRPHAAVGYLPTVLNFCKSYSLPFDASLWSGQEFPTITYRIAPEPEEDPEITAEREEILKAIFTPWTEEQEQAIIKEIEEAMELERKFARAA